MHRWLIVVSMLSTGAASAAPAWTWVDENGQTHFSDRPVPGARQIDLPEFDAPARAPTPPARLSPSANAQPGPPGQQAPARYRSFTVVSPTQQETLWNIGAVLDVQVELVPPLQNGHEIDVYLDGQRIDVNATSAAFTVPEVHRGVHSLQAAVVDASGRELIRSLAVTFMVQQTTIFNPNNPNNPARRSN
jgi:hypothetical protein